MARRRTSWWVVTLRMESEKGFRTYLVEDKNLSQFDSQMRSGKPLTLYLGNGNVHYLNPMKMEMGERVPAQTEPRMKDRSILVSSLF